MRSAWRARDGRRAGRKPKGVSTTSSECATRSAGDGIAAARVAVNAHPEPSERELVDRLRAGDDQAFSVLVQRHHAGMVRVALSHVRTRAVAEEVAQEAWIGLLRGLDRFEGRSSLKTWLYRIVVNRAITTGLKERQHVPVEDSELEADDGLFSRDGWWVTPPVHWADEVVDRLTAHDAAPTILELITSLPPAQRRVVTLRDVEGLSSVEVCEILCITEGNQRVLLHRGRARIRTLLEGRVLR
jgi:RNA polymerase sigma-70 factor (ECF subfamily)